MARTRAVDALERAGVEFTAHVYTIESSGGETFGEAVAAALGVAPERVYKTLVAEADGRPVVAIVPVTGTLSLKALAQAAGAKRAAMAEPAVAERLTGYVVGGISPFAHRRALPVIIDESVGPHDRVLVSGGRRGLQVELAPADLVSVTGAQVAPLSA
jgi:Cys-tRNA(Pro)/Cys-tRNA(Cys) deacylase